MNRRALPNWPPLRDARGRLICCLPPEEPPAREYRLPEIFLGGAGIAFLFFLLLLWG